MHALAFVDPVFGLCFPAAQSIQADDEFEPTSELYLPAVQLSQELAPPPRLPVRMSLVESQNVKR